MSTALSAGRSLPDMPRNIKSQPVKLYSPMQVGACTFLGSLAAGFVLLALNYEQLGRRDAARNTIVAGILATIALIAGIVGLARVESAGVELLMRLIAPMQVVMMLILAKKLQGRIFNDFVASGGKPITGFKPLGIAAACMVGVVGILSSILTMLP